MGECWQHAPDCTFVNVGESKTKELWQLSWPALRHLAGVIAERPGHYQEVQGGGLVTPGVAGAS